MGGVVVRRFLKFGCLGIGGSIVIMVLLAMLGSQLPKPQQSVGGSPAASEKQALPTVGQTALLAGWEVTLLDFGPFDRFSPGKPASPKPQGMLVVADLRIKNLQNTTSNFTTSDFLLKAGDGREFKPAGQTGSIDRGFVISQTVQPGLVTENRVVFDIDPAARDFVLTTLRMQFAVPMP